MKLIFYYIIVLSLLAISCSDGTDSYEAVQLQVMQTPKGFPIMEHPVGNEFSMERWELGKKLFFDPILSKDGKISCASCHDPMIAFSDDKKTSIGSDGLIGSRNSPSLANVGYHPYFTREGGVPTLEMQILVPIQEHNEFNNNIVSISDTLSKIPEYVKMAKDAYDQLPNSFVITRALAQFERSLISGQSNYDLQYSYEVDEAMSQSALRGQKLFESERLSCSSCHSGFNFTDYSFQNNGLYEAYDDKGRARLTQESSDNALFKVPSLRNIELTGPYMHDGSIVSLYDVIEHYNTGGKDHVNKSNIIKPLNLTEIEKEDLISFLESLTDQYFISNKNISHE